MKPFSNMELSSFCGQISLILKSGISALEGLTVMTEDAVSDDERTLLNTLISDMQEGESLHQALKSTGYFPAYMLHMIEIGEETGTLDEVMNALQSHYAREDSIHKSIRNSITYPLIMTGMMVVVILVLLVKVMPIFNQVFIQLGTEMTGFSRVLMNIGTTISRYSVLLIGIVLLLVAFCFYGTKTASCKKLFRSISARLKFTKSIREEIAVCRFASGMAITLSSGLNPERSLELASSLNEDPLFQQKLQIYQTSIKEGSEMTDALLACGIFTGLYARLASIGSKTGSMDQVMEQIAELCQEDIDARMNNVLAILEPTLVVLLSLIVGVILLSVMLPLMGIMSSI